MNPNNKPTSREKGQSLVEFAFGVVVLVILVAGIFDLGRALFTYMAMRDAAQEGALWASVNANTSNLSTAVENRVLNASDTISSLQSDLVISVNINSQACGGNAVTVHVSYPNYPLTMPFMGAIIGSQTVPIHASVTDTILRPACQ